MKQKVLFCCATLLVVVGFRLEARAQSFLEKLEQAVQNQLDAPSSVDQLPAPAERKRQIPGTPPKTAPSISPGSPTESQTASTLPSDPSEKIYLGLEAENSAGGALGVRVAVISNGSPAWKAGFKVGDRIFAINGFAIGDLDGMVKQLKKTRPGETVEFMISRGGKNKKLTAVLMDANLASQVATPSPSMVGSAWLGVNVNDLTASFRQQFGISVFRGAAVSGVNAGSPAAQAGIHAGDAIIEVNGRPIESARDLSAWLATVAPGQPVTILFYRGGFPKSAEIVLEKNPAISARANPPVMSQPSGSSSPSGQDGAMQSIVEPSGQPQKDNNRLPADSANLVQQLEQQNAFLEKELRDTRTRLRETEKKLEQIMELLNRK